MSPSPEAAALEAVADGIGIKFVVTHGPESRILLYGCGLYLASNVIGQGLGVLADPRAGLMAAAAGLLICGLSIARCKGSEHTRRIVRQLRAALLVGFSSFVVALVVAAARPFYDLNNSTWGAVPPPWLTFSALYGTISLITTFGVSRWFHRATAF